MTEVFLKAYAKINIGLNIISKRPNGYHNVETIFQQIDLHDVIKLSKNQKSEIVIISNDSSLPIDEKNICYRAADYFFKAVGKRFGLVIEIEKNIPVGAGLGGGSSNAASVLKGIKQLFNISIADAELAQISSKLGADVPFFLMGKTAFASGIGDVLTRIKLHLPDHCLLIYPNLKISTEWAYKNFNFDLTKSKKIIKLSRINHNHFDFFELRKFLHNDFEEVAFREYPLLKDIKELLYTKGAVFASMSGSGSSIYGLFAKYEDAVEAKKIFPKSYQNFLTQLII